MNTLSRLFALATVALPLPPYPPSKEIRQASTHKPGKDAVATTTSVASRFPQLPATYIAGAMYS